MILSGTGHRPKGLELDYSVTSENFLKDFCVKMLRKIIIEKDVKSVISGGATGYDQALAKASLELGIPLVFALPYFGFGSNWPILAQKGLWAMMERATVVFTDEQDYVAAWQYTKRDKYMVDNSDLVMALFSGDPKTGTGITVAYANKKFKPIVNCWDDWLVYKSSVKTS